MTADTRTSLVSELRRLGLLEERLFDERLFDERLFDERLFDEPLFVERFFVDWLRRVDEEADGVMRHSGEAWREGASVRIGSPGCRAIDSVLTA